VIARPRLLRNWRLRGRDFLTTPIFRVLIKAFVGATALKDCGPECASQPTASGRLRFTFDRGAEKNLEGEALANSV